MGEMKAIKGFIILDNDTRLAVSSIVRYIYRQPDSDVCTIMYVDGTGEAKAYVTHYTLEEIDEAIIKAQL